MKILSEDSTSPSCSLCGQYHLPVITCEAEYVCERCAEKTRTGRARASRATKTMERSLRAKAETARIMADGKEPIVQLEYDIVSSGILSREALQSQASVAMLSGGKVCPQHLPKRLRAIVKLTKSELKAIADLEKRHTSIHEAGQSLVCSLLGGLGIPTVWANSAKNIRSGQKTWLGAFKMYAEPGTMKIDAQTRIALGVMKTPKNWRVLLGLAGMVAEQIADGVTDAEVIACAILGSIELDEASQTDMALMGEAWTVSDVAKVVQMLLKWWPEIEDHAASLTC